MCRRREELAADAFGVDLAGDFDGLAELRACYWEHMPWPDVTGVVARMLEVVDRRWFGTHPRIRCGWKRCADGSTLLADRKAARLLWLSAS